MGYVYQTSGYQGFGGIEDLVGKEMLSRLTPESVQQIAAEAEILAKKGAAEGWNTIKAEAFKYAYAQGRGLLQTLQNTEWGKTSMKIGNSLMEIGMSANKFVDSSGIQDKIQAAGSFIKASTSFARALGANEAATDIISAWLAVATSCAAMITANAFAGTIACAATAVATAIAQLAEGPDTYKLDPCCPAAVYTPNGEQSPYVAADAVRLAAVLKTHYNIGSFDVFDTGGYLAQATNPAGKDFFSEGGYPQRPPMDAAGNSASIEEALPGTDMRTVLVLMAAVDQLGSGAGASVNRVLKLLSLHGCDTDWEGHACQGDWNYPGTAKLYHRYLMGDVNVAAIEAGASLARGQLVAEAGGVGSLPWAGEWNAKDGFNWDYSNKETNPHGALQPVTRQDLMPFLRVDELLNYFSAITIGDLETPTGRNDGLPPDILGAYLETNKPIRVQDAPDSAKPAFSPVCWTRLNKGLPPDCLTKAELGCGEGLFNAVWKDRDPTAIRELASIRLMAAMSHLLMLYKWRKSGVNSDLIAAMSNPAEGTIARKFQTPVDPRQAVPKSAAERHIPVIRPEAVRGAGIQIWKHNYYGWSLYAVGKRWCALAAKKGGSPRSLSGLTGEVLAAEVRKREALMQEVGKEAYKAAVTTHLALYPRIVRIAESLKTVYGLTTGAATGNLAAIKTGALQVGTLAQFEQTCRNAGGVPIWVTENGSKQGKCVPPGSPEASGGGGVALVALGAAALLALKYLK